MSKFKAGVGSRLESIIKEGKYAEKIVASDVIESNLKYNELERLLHSEREAHRMEVAMLKTDLSSLRAIADAKPVPEKGGNGHNFGSGYFPGILPSRVPPKEAVLRAEELMQLNNQFVHVIQALEVRVETLQTELEVVYSYPCPNCGKSLDEISNRHGSTGHRMLTHSSTRHGGESPRNQHSGPIARSKSLASLPDDNDGGDASPSLTSPGARMKGRASSIFGSLSKHKR